MGQACLAVKGGGVANPLETDVSDDNTASNAPAKHRRSAAVATVSKLDFNQVPGLGFPETCVWQLQAEDKELTRDDKKLRREFRRGGA